MVVTRFGNIFGPGDLNASRIIPGIMKTLITKRGVETSVMEHMFAIMSM